MPPMPEARASARTSAERIDGSRCVGGIGQDVEGQGKQARRRQGSRSPRRTPCARSAGRGAGRRRPWPASRHGSANSSARIRARQRPAIAVSLRRRQASQRFRPEGTGAALAAIEHAMAHGCQQAGRPRDLAAGSVSVASSASSKAATSSALCVQARRRNRSCVQSSLRAR